MGNRTPKRLDAAALWEYAVKVLSARARSTGEIRQKLKMRAEREEDIEPVIARLKDYGYLDDRRFAEGFATARLENEKFGKSRVRSDLRQRRVAPPLVEQTVKNVYAEVDEEALIEEFVRRKYRLATREGLFQQDKDLASAYRRLLRAGFATSNIVRVLKKFARDPELLDQFEPPEEIEEE